MAPFITKGQACCLVLGEEVTEANRAKCKSIVQDTPFDVVYTADDGKKHPRAMGKQVIARDPFTYLHYPDTPPTSPNLLPVIATDTESASSASSATSNEDTLVIKPTKYSILDFFDCIASQQAPVDKERYVYKNWTPDELFDMAKKYIPDISDYCTSRNVAEWLSKDGRFGRTVNTRTAAGLQTRARSLWVLKDEIQENELRNVFNQQLYQQTVRNSSGWITVGYARKSRSNENLQTRTALLQKMVKNLRVKNLCEKVYVSPVCAADSPLLKRDSVPTASAMATIDKLRHKDGDFQDLIMFATTTNLSIRLVALDYAGLSSNPADLRAFLKQMKAIKELVIDHGHKFELLNRQQLLHGDAVKRFNCRKGGVKRSLL